MSTLLKELKKNKSIKWSNMIVGQSGRDMTQTRNDEKALKSNQQISGNTASNSAANRNIEKKKKVLP